MKFAYGFIALGWIGITYSCVEAIWDVNVFLALCTGWAGLHVTGVNFYLMMETK